MLPKSLKGRLLFAGMAGAVAAAVAGSLVIWLQFWPSSSTKVVRSVLQEEIQDITDGLGTVGNGMLRVSLSKPNENTYDAMPRDAAYLVLADGQVAASSIEGPALSYLKEMRPGEMTTQLEGGHGPIHLELAEANASFEGRELVIRVARSDRLVTTLNAYAGELYLRGSLMAIAIALLTFVFVSYFTVHRMVRPLQRASQVAARLEPRNLSMRLRSSGLPSEIVPLIEAFNGALARLEDGFRIQQEFLASAAHELKTPLALLQAEIELGGTANSASLLRETALMARIVHQLLHLAEASEGNNYSLEPLQLSAELEDAVSYMSRLAHKNSVTLELVTAESVQVNADRGSLFVLAKNLIENAINHSPSGGHVVVVQDSEGFSVEDGGPGVPPELVPMLFQRFWRASDQEHDGAGLGLTICREICQVHRWQIYYDRGNAGARFKVLMGSH